MNVYTSMCEQDVIKRTHFFGGRYENIYLDRAGKPALGTVLDQAVTYAGEVLGMPCNKLRIGFWINDMGPGTTTSEHDHDEYDELLSGVYYVRVPDNSGELIIKDPHSRLIVTPQEGMFVFFAPDVKHSVSMNNSRERRISIGMNIGPC